jgi:hypothetical protein
VSDVEVSEDRVETLIGDLIEQTGRDPALGPKERETVVRFASDETNAHVHTEEPGLVRRLLAHGHTTVEAVRVIDGDEAQRLTFDDVVANGGVDGRVAALRGRLPVMCLTVSSVPRKEEGHAAVVSKEVFK